LIRLNSAPGEGVGIAALTPQQLRRRCDPAAFAFATTAELDAHPDALGQARAHEALKFGVAMWRAGYNLFVLGSPGAGKHAFAMRHVKAQAQREPAQDVWCYVNNFDDPRKPLALRLPSETGIQLRADMVQLVEELQSAIPAAFESDEYHTRVEQIDSEFEEMQRTAFGALAQDSAAKSISLLRTPTGFSFAPSRNDEVLTSEQYEALSEQEKEQIAHAVAELQKKLEKLLWNVVEWRKARRDRLRKLNEEMTTFAVGALVDDLVRRYEKLPDVVAYLDAVKKDVLEHAQIFNPSGDSAAGATGREPEDLHPLRRYLVNVLVDGPVVASAPVVQEDNPNFQNLVGRVEHIARYGALVTDFALIQPGALHRANGGYLLLDVLKVLQHPFAWEGLKRALVAREIRIESLGQMSGFAGTVSLEPQPIPLNVKVILFGERIYYYLLQAYDADFDKLFKVAVDFEDDTPRDADSQTGYAQLIAAIARDQQLLAFDREAVGRAIDYGARFAGDAQKISLNLQRMTDLLTEADYWARQQDHRAGYRPRLRGLAWPDRSHQAPASRSDFARLSGD
jgi:predicted ATP-dependent protease